MNQLILVKYASEIFLKGLNRGKFERKLLNNIKQKLEGLNYEVINDQNRWFIKAENIDEAVERVRKVFQQRLPHWSFWQYFFPIQFAFFYASNLQERRFPRRLRTVC